MAKSKFYLKEPNSSKETPVIFFFSYAGRRLKYYTGVSIHPRDWNEKQFSPRNKDNNSTLANYRILLNRISEAAETEYSRLILAKEIPTHEKIREAIEVAVGKRDQMQDQDKMLLGYTRKFIRQRQASSKYKKGSITVYKTCLKHLENHFSEDIPLDAITKDDLISFVKYLENQQNSQSETYFTKNHVNKICSTLKTIFTEAFEDDCTENPQLLKKKIFPSKDTPTKIALTKKEIKSIYYLDINKITRSDGTKYRPEDLASLEVTRDLFAMSCFSGLRYSDIANLKKANFVKEGEMWYLTKRTQKTNKDVLVPLNPLAVELLNKYGGELPKGASNQRMNAGLKIIGEAAGINEVVIVNRNEGGVEVSREYNKYELITSHTARRSFVTISLQEGVPVETVKQLGGWKSSSSFARYDKMKQEEHAKIAAKHKHFKEY